MLWATIIKSICNEESHKRFPDKPFLGSENGGGYEQWCAVRDNAYISGQFLWTGIDYLGEANWPQRSAGCGCLDTCGFEKDAFYFYKSVWNQNEKICISVPTLEFKTGKGNGVACHLLYELRGC